jgi:hypothetical protein
MNLPPMGYDLKRSFFSTLEFHAGQSGIVYFPINALKQTNSHSKSCRANNFDPMTN